MRTMFNETFGDHARESLRELHLGWNHRIQSGESWGHGPSSIMFTWRNGAYIKYRYDGPSHVHVQELANSSSGEKPEGLYRWLVHKSGVPQFFAALGVKTLTCEPSDADAQSRLGRYDVWEIWEENSWHPVWVWWLGERRIEWIEGALALAHAVQEERRETVRSPN